MVTSLGNNYGHEYTILFITMWQLNLSFSLNIGFSFLNENINIAMYNWLLQEIVIEISNVKTFEISITISSNSQLYIAIFHSILLHFASMVARSNFRQF